MNHLCVTMGRHFAGVEKNRSATSLRASDRHRKASMKPKRPRAIRLGHYYCAEPLRGMNFPFCVAPSGGINAALPGNLGGKAQPTGFAKASPWVSHPACAFAPGPKVSDLTVRTMGGALFFMHEKAVLWVPSLPERYFQSGRFEDQTSFQSGSFETQTSLNLAF